MILKRLVTGGNVECTGQTIPNQTYGSICDSGSFTYNITGATTGTTYIWSAPTFPLIGSAQPIPQSNIFQNTIGLSGTNARTPQTGSFVVTGITQDGCTSSPFNVSVYVSPTPNIKSTGITINADFVTSGATFNFQPISNTNNTVPLGTTYTWTTNAVSGITGNSDQATPQSSVSQTLTTSLTGSPANVIYTVTPSTSYYGSTCVGAPFTLTITVNPRPLRVNFNYTYAGTKSSTQVIHVDTIYCSDNNSNTINLSNIQTPTGSTTSSSVVDYYYPSTAFQYPNNGFNVNRCIYKTGTGANFYLSGSTITFLPGDGTGQIIYNIPTTFISSTTQCTSHTFGGGSYLPQYGQHWDVQIIDR